MKIGDREISTPKLNVWDSHSEVVRIIDGDADETIVCSTGPREIDDGKWFEPLRERLEAVIPKAEKEPK